MRTSVALVLLLALPGCLLEGEPCKIDPSPGKSCSYGIGHVAATTTMSGAWDREVAQRAFLAMGFELASSAGTVAATRVDGDVGLRASVANDTAIRFEAEFRPQGERAGIGYTREQAEAVARQMETELRPRGEGLLAAFERESGWARERPLTWDAGIVVI